METMRRTLTVRGRPRPHSGLVHGSLRVRKSVRLDGCNPLGFSLLELLVAVLVVAVGALGVAGLQLASMQNNRGAMQYSVTTSLATDLVERMRANPGADYGTGLGTAPPPFQDCVTSDCTPAQLAQFDLAVWKCALGKWREDTTCTGLPAAIRPMTVLPEGDGKVAEDAGVVTVTVVWGRAGREAFEVAVRR